MKYLKSFFEAVIEPYEFKEAFDKLSVLKKVTLEDLKEIFDPLDVEFVDIDYFRSKLQTKKEIELLPVNLPPMLGGVRFAAHNIYTNKMYVCINDDFLISLNSKMKSQLISFLDEVLKHESIHKQQGEKRNIVVRNLERSPNKPEEYFSSKDEIMAYAQSFIDQCHQRGLSDEAILKQIRGSKEAVSWIERVYGHRKIETGLQLTPEVINRFKKYVFQYLTKKTEGNAIIGDYGTNNAKTKLDAKSYVEANLYRLIQTFNMEDEDISLDEKEKTLIEYFERFPDQISTVGLKTFGMPRNEIPITNNIGGVYREPNG